MPSTATSSIRIGTWLVTPASGQISRNDETAPIDERSIRLLLCLADHAGEVVSIDQLLTHVWPEVTVSPDSVYQAVASLRRQLGDDPKHPSYIATIPRLGYKMVASVKFGDNLILPADDSSTRMRPAGVLWAAALAVALCLALGAAFLARGKSTSARQSIATASAPLQLRSVAVLPFLDLTEGMKQEEFADGMTEELIDKLSKVPGTQVPSATSSFYFKDKQLPVADIARALRVSYVLDGSVRKSGTRIRVAARLVRADSGFVVWSETYDRSFNDLLVVQDDIAGEVTKALTLSINPREEQPKPNL